MLSTVSGHVDGSMGGGFTKAFDRVPKIQLHELFLVVIRRVRFKLLKFFHAKLLGKLRCQLLMLLDLFHDLVLDRLDVLLALGNHLFDLLL